MKNNHILKKILLGLGLLFTVLSAALLCDFHSDATLIVNGTEMSRMATITYNGTQLRKITFNGVTVWEYGAAAYFHDRSGGTQTVAIEDDATMNAFNPNQKTASSGGNFKFYGWSKDSKATSTSQKCGNSVQLTEPETHFYAIYVHHHTGDENHEGGCYTKKEETEKKCLGNMSNDGPYDRNNDGVADDWEHVCETCGNSFWDNHWHDNGSGYDRCQKITGTEIKWKLDCGKTESTIETW